MDAPLHSVLRNAGPSASWRVEISEGRIRIKAMGTGNGRLDISMEISDYSMKDDISSYILSPPTTFPLPVDLHVIWWDETHGPEFWDEVLDTTPSLRSVILTSPLDIAQQVMDRLSTKAPLSSTISPRAPFLEKLRFDPDEEDLVTWSAGENEEEAVKTMLDKRRDIFIQGGVLDPPKLVVTGPTGPLFDETEGLWLDS
ncbi:hypothetical protein FRC05_004313 [Tulasnella sp. 425]|nr:hypothetical protein FRC05_004313 [Tulasnella sp. 425]